VGAVVPPAVSAAAVEELGAEASAAATGRMFSNTGWNIVGSGAPLLVAVVAIPILIHAIGNDRFGILTLAWTLIGYFGLFDLGLGRALTKIIAEKIRFNLESEIPGVFWSCLFLLTLFGGAGALIVGLSARWLASSVLKIPAALLPETILAFWLIAAAIPLVATSSGLRGCLEAKQRFAAVNGVRMLVGILGFLCPLMVLPFSHSLGAIIGSLCAMRLITWAAYFYLCVDSWPQIWRERRRGNAPLLPMLRYGGWITVSSLVSPLMVSMDRFLISGLLSISVVAFYVTPQEMITKVLVVPMALQTAVFPIFSASLAAGDKYAGVIYRRAIDSILLVLFPVCLLVVAASRELLTLWLGASFAEHSFRVLMWLSVGIIINGVAHVPMTVVQGGNRPDIAAKLHLLELSLYGVTCWFLIKQFGIEGAAVAWVLRVTLDAVLLLWFARRWVPGPPMNALKAACGAAILGVACVLTYRDVSLVLRGFYAGAVLLAFASINFHQLRNIALRR
jgi:O-antigen/teichoic acid export membrane protein